MGLRLIFEYCAHAEAAYTRNGQRYVLVADAEEIPFECRDTSGIERLVGTGRYFYVRRVADDNAWIGPDALTCADAEEEVAS